MSLHRDDAGLAWIVARAIERVRLIDENQQLQQMKRRRLQTEHDEVTRLLCQQRAMLEAASTIAKPDFPRILTARYHELLRTYIIMGAGNLADEISQLVDQLVASGLTARQAMQLHLHALEELLNGLGNRSTRHAMTRADMLILEVMVNLAER